MHVYNTYLQDLESRRVTISINPWAAAHLQPFVLCDGTSNVYYHQPEYNSSTTTTTTSSSTTTTATTNSASRVSAYASSYSDVVILRHGVPPGFVVSYGAADGPATTRSMIDIGGYT
jgi:hypothetical protein